MEIIFAPPHSHADKSSTANAPLKPASSTTTPSSHHTTRSLEALGLLWLETTHALIHYYRAKLTEMDKVIAESPQAHRRSRGGARGLEGGMPPPGPTARRRLVHSFRAFLGEEEDFYRVLLGRLAASLGEKERINLRTVGVIVEWDEGEVEQEQQRSDEEKAKRRTAVVQLAHKALICFGDLARYRELYNEASGSATAGAGGGKKEAGGRRGKSKTTESSTAGAEKKVKNWSRAAECYHQARLLLPENGGLRYSALCRESETDVPPSRQPVESACRSLAIRLGPTLIHLPLLPRSLSPRPFSYRTYQPRDHLYQGRYSLVR